MKEQFTSQFPIIAQGILYLASVCDHCAGKDRQGFNRNDTETGHSLANALELGLDLTLFEAATFGQELIKYVPAQLSAIGITYRPLLSEIRKAARLLESTNAAKKSSGLYNLRIDRETENAFYFYSFTTGQHGWIAKSKVERFEDMWIIPDWIVNTNKWIAG